MNISAAGNLSRVSTSLRTFTLLSQLQNNSVSLFELEQQLSSGRRILSIADDPIASERIARSVKSLESQDQILSNLRFADGFLAAADSSITEITDLLNEAARIASEQAGNLQTAEERESQAVIIDGIIDQLLNVGNRQYQSRFLFGGRQTTEPVLNSGFGRVTLAGDFADLRTIVDPGFTLPFNVTAETLFGIDLETVGGTANFNVAINSNVRVSELRGATERGITLGQIRITESPGQTFDVDISGAETVGDVIDIFNNAAATIGSSVTLQIDPASNNGFQLTAGPFSTITVENVGSSPTATDLGILGSSAGPGVPLTGTDVNRRIALQTALADIQPSGLSLTDGVTITNGDLSTVVTFDSATTIQDVLNRLNASGVGIHADINANGDGIQIRNLVAGSQLLIGENGGNDAQELGIRTLDGGVPLSRLNGGRGINTFDGPDFEIVDPNGVAFSVDISSAITLQDVLDEINAAAGTAGADITASLSPDGGGIQLTSAGGPGNITVNNLNQPAAQELGILKTGSSTGLTGDVVGGFTQPGVFSALYRLRDALIANDSSEITEAGDDIDDLRKEIINVLGAVGARSRDLRNRVNQTEDAVAATEILLSEVRDVDFVEAVTRFQQAQTALQASLQVGSANLNLSLLDFLG